MTIVYRSYRPKPARKRKAQTAEIAVPTIVRSISRKQAKLENYARRHRPADASE